jgi:hypothetical protein
LATWNTERGTSLARLGKERETPRRFVGDREERRVVAVKKNATSGGCF